MGKAARGKRNASGSNSPYQKPGGAPLSKAASAIFKFNTDIGQHILKNPTIADAIVDKANIQPSQTVLEVGPGPGILTTRILQKAKKVVAVELDPRMAAELTKTVQATPAEKKLQIVLGDFVKTDLSKLPPFQICISNTPYQISSPLIFKLLSMPNPPKTCVLMVQREFALRLIARPGDSLYSRLSVNAQFFSRISHIMKVGKNNFRPPPQVESSVVRVEPKADRPDISWDEWDGMLRICFVRKNKTLRAGFMGTKVRALIERNWITWVSMHPEKVTHSDIDFLQGKDVPVAQGGDDDMDMGDGEDAPEAGDDEDDIFMDLGDENDTPVTATKGSLVAIGDQQVPRAMVTKLIQVKIQRVLEQAGLSNARANKCDENNFLQLLHGFNTEGIHFS
ncbi:dimethyladenosine transferase [Aspergillus clavatus NRRL 1]|uniref:rRNA adenine N(6)-methyltransferase n=1 Tax=Aspergillus clavatus (strain ATCC 1007 / CBS 513.65 / DSM 816 / NCTC 3887 / NRRL 1 / QM 1276 / 107) TaxID=344612 RepID=A1CDH1_ASPCL|nr:dimethyladenosine transferase [Aspergillus clavatus NRRL 1]EAW11898.1 dimethyladenosine transferase [Aspergillus clavatus NRRL 1]